MRVLCHSTGYNDKHYSLLGLQYWITSICGMFSVRRLQIGEHAQESLWDVHLAICIYLFFICFHLHFGPASHYQIQQLTCLMWSALHVGIWRGLTIVSYVHLVTLHIVLCGKQTTPQYQTLRSSVYFKDIQFTTCGSSLYHSPLYVTYQ